MRLSWIGMGPDPTTRALTRDQVARATETQRETGDHRGTGWRILEATSQETRGPPDWKRKGSLLEPLEGVRPSPHHGFELLVSQTTTASTSTSVVLSPPPPPLCGSSSRGPRKPLRGPSRGRSPRALTASPSELVFLSPLPRLGGSDMWTNFSPAGRVLLRPTQRP